MAFENTKTAAPPRIVYSLYNLFRGLPEKHPGKKHNLLNTTILHTLPEQDRYLKRRQEKTKLFLGIS